MTTPTRRRRASAAGEGGDARPRDADRSQQTILAAEAYAVHYERLREQPDQYKEEVRDRLLAGESIQTREYINAQQLKHAAVREFDRVLQEVDMLASPTLPVLPTAIDQREVNTHGRKEHVRSALTRFTGPTNINGFPSLSIPCGFSKSGLPIGLQLIGGAFDEACLYQFGYCVETATHTKCS